ncbi:MAG TPA: succinate dehydrogenase/fumarate reductase iron-sulfur subunit [Pilimelia sp.]|nr:succinate dehydrogenase/fumarate reductase iron-sulfur subunit [Pilimelia sp.]
MTETAAASSAGGSKRHFKVWRGDASGGELRDYQVEVNEGEVVLDVIHRLQATQEPDLACRWNCKAGKCGSCSMEINGMPRLGCMTRMSTFDPGETVTVTPLRTFPVIRDLVTDVSFNYVKARETPAFAPPADLAPGEYRMQQVDVERSQEFRKCIECFLCQNTCHVVRDHEENKKAFAGPRYFIRAAELDMHPLDTRTDRKEYAQDAQGLGYCNITKCCTEVCPEHIKITDNGIIPMKERAVDRKYDPLVWLGRKIFRRDEVANGDAPEVGHLREEDVQHGDVNWHRSIPPAQTAAVGPDGRLPMTELTADRAGAQSPFGDDVTFPVPAERLNYHHRSEQP